MFECLYSIRTESLNLKKKYAKNRLEKVNILELNQYTSGDKMPYIIYVDDEKKFFDYEKKSLMKKIDGCENNSKNVSTAKIDEHILCGYSASTIWASDLIENKHTLNFGKDCIKRFFFS